MPPLALPCPAAHHPVTSCLHDDGDGYDDNLSFVDCVMVVTRIVVSIITFLVIEVLFLISDDDGEVDVTIKAKDDDVIYDELDFTEATHDDVIYDDEGGGGWDKGEDDEVIYDELDSTEATHDDVIYDDEGGGGWDKEEDDDVIYDELDFTEATHDDVIYDGDDDDVITLKGGGGWDKGEDDDQRHY